MRLPKQVTWDPSRWFSECAEPVAIADLLTTQHTP